MFDYHSAVKLTATATTELWKVSLAGRHIGSVRLTYKGYLALGVFLFGPKLEPLYFRTAEAAAQAMAREYVRRASLTVLWAVAP